MNQFSKTSKREKKLKTRCLRYKKGKCVSKYTTKRIQRLQKTGNQKRHLMKLDHNFHLFLFYALGSGYG